jgi:hypothetical protein
MSSRAYIPGFRDITVTAPEQSAKCPVTVKAKKREAQIAAGRSDAARTKERRAAGLAGRSSRAKIADAPTRARTRQHE